MKPLHCCGSCKGLFPSNTDLAQHQRRCDSTIGTSTSLFAVDRSLLFSCLSFKYSESTDIENLSLAESDLERSIMANSDVDFLDSVFEVGEFKDEEYLQAKTIGSELAFPLVSNDSKFHMKKRNKSGSALPAKVIVVKPESFAVGTCGMYDSLAETAMNMKEGKEIKDILILPGPSMESDCTDDLDSATCEDNVVKTEMEIEQGNLSEHEDSFVISEEQLGDSPTHKENSAKSEEKLGYLPQKKGISANCKKQHGDVQEHRGKSGAKQTEEKQKSEKEPQLTKFARFKEYRKLIEDPDGKTKHYLFQCPVCSYSTEKIGLFDRHMRSMHSVSDSLTFKCDKCDYTSQFKLHFTRHIQTHLKPVLCDLCGETFSCNKDMQRHKWKHTGEVPYKCDQCPFSTRFREHMSLHKKNHKGIKIKCDFPGCDFSTLYLWSLKSHKAAKHSNTFKYACDECPYQSNCKQSIEIHIKNHRGIKEYGCSICDYKAASKKEVSRHIRSHTKEKVYFCDMCDYSSGIHSAFRLHLQRHFGIKPYQCSKCGYKSIMRGKITRHIKQRTICNGGDVLVDDYNPKLNMKKYYRPSRGKIHLIGMENVEFTSSDDVQHVEMVVEHGEHVDMVIGDNGEHVEMVVGEHGEHVEMVVGKHDGQFVETLHGVIKQEQQPMPGVKSQEKQQPIHGVIKQEEQHPDPDSMSVVVSSDNIASENAGVNENNENKTIHVSDNSDLLSRIMQSDTQEIIIQYDPEGDGPLEFIEVTTSIPKEETGAIDENTTQIIYQ